MVAALNSLAAGTAYAIPYTFSTTTTDADPGAGYIRLDNATQNAATTIRADLIGAAGTDWTSVLDTFDASTSAVKGQIRLVKLGDPSKWLAFNVTARATATGYRNLTVANVGYSAASPFADGDSLVMMFTRTGDKGDAGLIGTVSVVRSNRTSNAILTSADSGKLIDITSGTFAQTFTAAATLGSGWYCWIRNSGTGDITLDPNASELIDGLTSYIMYPGEVRLVQCDGAAFTSVVLTPFSRDFLTSGTFVKPPGYQKFKGLLWGAGGSGGKGGSNWGAGGGGGGACVPFEYPAALLAASVSFTIGAGGAPQSTANTPGNVGGNSVFGSVTAYGGGGGGGFASADAYGGGGGGALSTGSAGHNNVTSSGAGGMPYYNPSGGTNAFSGGAGFGGGSGGNDIGPRYSAYGGAGGGGCGGFNYAGGNSLYGGAGGGGGTSSTSTAGGTSTFGGAGGAGGVGAAAATAGVVPAGGGGGAYTAASSGAGANGILRISGV
jgi:hypothetical protein